MRSRLEPGLRAVMQLLAIICIAIVAVWGYTVWQSFEGRVLIVNSQRAACRRGKLDRAANAAGWRTAEAARLATGTPTDLIAAGKYGAIAEGLEQRSRVDCAAAFPGPSLLPF